MLAYLPIFKVSAPLSSNCLRVACSEATDALKTALDSWGFTDRDITEHQSGPGWVQFKIEPPLPLDFSGEGKQEQPSVLNPGSLIEILEVETQTSVLIPGSIFDEQKNAEGGS